MLRKIRIFLAIISLVAVTLLFCDVTGFAQAHWPWMAKIQLVPAVLALNIAALIVLAVLVFAFGRIYCSVICPLGIWQDVVSRVRSWFLPKKKRRLGRFRFSKAHTALRTTVLWTFGILLAAGFFVAIPASLAGLIDPYSAFGRIAASIFRPGAVAVNNVAADVAASADSYAFAHVAAAPLALGVFAIAIVSLVVVSLMAWRTGRGYCNSFCPVGTLLGYASRVALLRPLIQEDKCTRCGACGRHCKSQCIDTKNHVIDLSRCVVCFDCVDACTEGAIVYGRAIKDRPADADASVASRRAFLVGGAIVASGLASNVIAKKGDGGLAPLKDKKPSTPETPVVPPGARSLHWLSDHCTACQLCISACPNGALVPSTALDSFMQPRMKFNVGYCRPECTSCSDVCPTDALSPIDVAEKSSVKIGTAVVDLDQCISAAYGQSCGLCSRSCPAGAIVMIPKAEGDSKLRPLVDSEACIGCGSCEYHCPVGTAGNIRSDRPAIHVEGIEMHRTI